MSKVKEMLSELRVVIPIWWNSEYIESDKKSRHLVYGEFNDDKGKPILFRETCTVGGATREYAGFFAAIPDNNAKMLFYLDEERQLRMPDIEHWGLINPNMQSIYFILKAGVIWKDTTNCKKQIKTLKTEVASPTFLYGNSLTTACLSRKDANTSELKLRALIPGINYVAAIDHTNNRYLLHGEAIDSIFRNTEIVVRHGPIRHIACGK